MRADADACQRRSGTRGCRWFRPDDLLRSAVEGKDLHALALSDDDVTAHDRYVHRLLEAAWRVTELAKTSRRRTIRCEALHAMILSVGYHQLGCRCRC